MNPTAPRLLATLAVALSLPLSGCIAGIKDEIQSQSVDGATGTLALSLSATNVPGALEHLEVTLESVHAHLASVALPDGYYTLDLVGPELHLVENGAPEGASSVASGAVPAGAYDQLLVRIASATAERGAGGFTDNALPIDVPFILAFELEEGKETAIEIALDADASTASGFTPTVARAIVRVEGDIVDETTDVPVGGEGSAAPPKPLRAPPVARMAIFAPDGAQIYKPSFLAPDDIFVNDVGSAVPSGGEVRFAAGESEVVEPGATLDTYQWNFDDAMTSEGITVAHAFALPGVYEVALTVVDTLGGRDSQRLRLVVLGWTATAIDTSFEDDDEGGWTWGESAPGLTTWQRTGAGRASDTSWHVAFHEGPEQVPYTPRSDAFLISPEIEVPAEWSTAGFSVYVSGSSVNDASSIVDSDDFFVSYTILGDEPEAVEVGLFNGEQGWLELGGLDALDAAIGKTVQFTFRFVAINPVPSGTGWFVDDFSVGGTEAAKVHSPELLHEASGHGGHEH